MKNLKSYFLTSQVRTAGVLTHVGCNFIIYFYCVFNCIVSMCMLGSPLDYLVSGYLQKNIILDALALTIVYVMYLWCLDVFFFISCPVFQVESLDSL